MAKVYEEIGDQAIRHCEQAHNLVGADTWGDAKTYIPVAFDLLEDKTSIYKHFRRLIEQDRLLVKLVNIGILPARAPWNDVARFFDKRPAVGGVTLRYLEGIVPDYQDRLSETWQDNLRAAFGGGGRQSEREQTACNNLYSVSQRHT